MKVSVQIHLQDLLSALQGMRPEAELLDNTCDSIFVFEELSNCFVVVVV